jgi:hypothetical protein
MIVSLIPSGGEVNYKQHFLKSFVSDMWFQQPTLSDMTMYELNFSLLVEQMLSKIADPAYRQIVVEVCNPI